MGTKGLFRIVAVLLSTALLGACASTSGPPKAEWDGLVRQPHARLNAVFVRPAAREDLGEFRSVVLAPVEISFARDFQTGRTTGRVQRRLDAGDLEAIRLGLANQFQRIFTEELQAGGYQVVTTAGPETLNVSAAIVDLFITAPDAARPTGLGRTYTADSGRMTLVLELRDSVTGEVLVRAIDAQSGRGGGTWMVSNRTTNSADAARAIRLWARALREGLDEFHAK